MGFRIFGLTIPFLTLLALSPGHGVTVKINDDYIVTWEREGDNKLVFELEVKTLGYIGFGFSRTSPGVMNGADIVISGFNVVGYLTDRHGVGHDVPVLDTKQNYVLIDASENATHTRVKFSRLLNTGDPEHDVEIIPGQRDIVWSMGATDDIEYHGASRGFTKLNLISQNSGSSVGVKAQCGLVFAVLIAARSIASS